MGSKECAKHKAANHPKDEYCRYEDREGVPSAESFFPILKHGVTAPSTLSASSICNDTATCLCP